MVERRIRLQAKEIAGAYYDTVRQDSRRRREQRVLAGTDPDKFMRTFPTVQDYMAGRYHQPDGSIVMGTPCWMHCIEPARQVFYKELASPLTTDYRKEQLYESLLEDKEDQLKLDMRGNQGSPNIYQLPKSKMDA